MLKDLAASGEDRPIPTRPGSELRVMVNLSPCLLRGDNLLIDIEMLGFRGLVSVTKMTPGMVISEVRGNQYELVLASKSEGFDEDDMIQCIYESVTASHKNL